MATYKMQISRLYQGEAFLLSVEIEPSNTGTIDEFVNAFMSEAVKLRAVDDQYQKQFNLRPAAAAVVNGPAGGLITSEEPITHIATSRENGVTRFKGFGGRWQKFGVPIYDEVLKQYPEIYKQAESSFETKLSGSMVIHMENDKPKKVLSLKLDMPF